MRDLARSAWLFFCRSFLCPVMRLGALLVVLAGFVGSPSIARADGDSVAASVGETASGLPGIGRVGVASPRAPHLAVTVGGGYGLTEAQSGESGSHHRLSGAIGAAVQPLRFFAAALTLDGRYDMHPDDVLGSSSSAVGEPRLIVRGAEAFGSKLALGAQLGLWIPGGEAPSLVPAASTLDARLLATYAPTPRLALAFNGGYRVDQSAHAIDAPQRLRLRQGDRIALQLSDFDAVLLGVGASQRLGALEILGELTWDVLIGQRAPSATESPLRVGAGARYHVTDAVQVELRSEIALNGRAATGPTEPLFPIEPRLAVLAGLRWVLPFGAPPSKTIGPEPTRPSPDGNAIAPVVVAVGSVRGHATEKKGDKSQPLAGVTVTVASQDVERTGQTSADGAFAVDDVPVGHVRIVARATGYEDATTEADVVARAPATVDLVMKRVIRPGQLRGLVRSFNGKPLAATIRVEPLGSETKTDADGMFQIDLPPGAYEIVVAAPGHAGQRRPVQVDENGVTILNADLRQGQ
ncbi:MAG: hypothetical protein JWM74_2147 [Myxococcaceae bacterium]|nr:hypothetical protein [Myxococcaceae bacterium]